MAIVITRAQGTNPIAPLTIFNRTTQQAKRANPHFRKIINFGYLIELFWGSPFKARVQEKTFTKLNGFIRPRKLAQKQITDL